MFRILVLDKVSPDGIGPLLVAPGVEVVQAGPVPEAELLARLEGFAAVMVRSATTVGAAAIAGAAALKVIGRAGVGVDNIDVPAATARRIPVFNSPDGNTAAAAEHTLGLMLALARHVVHGDASLRGGKWIREKLVGTELAGKTLGLVGLGKIGTHVAKLANALGMKVIAYDPYLPPAAFAAIGATHELTLEALLPRCDWVSLHLPKTPATTGLFGDAMIARMKPGARLVNAARGPLVDEAALLRALESGHLAGAALDVFVTEPCTSSPLFQLPNVVVTPHLGASTAEAQVKVAVDVSQKILRYLFEGDTTGAVNAKF